MIVGELIGIVFLFIIWGFFVIGVVGVRHEFKKEWSEMNDGWTMAYILFGVFGGVVGGVMLAWFFDFMGISQIWYDMFIGFWNSVI